MIPDIEREIWLEVCDACGDVIEREFAPERDMRLITHIDDFVRRVGQKKEYQVESCAVLLQEYFDNGKEETLLEIPIL